MDALAHIAEAERLLADRGRNVDINRSIQRATVHATLAVALNTLPAARPEFSPVTEVEG